MNECVICFEKKSLKNYGFNCDHKFCDNCLNRLNNDSCPLCRRSKGSRKQSKIIIESYYEITPSKYLENFINCINNNHTITIKKLFGVVVKCNNCNKIKAFNWMK